MSLDAATAPRPGPSPAPVAVLIPAYDDQPGLDATLAALAAEPGPLAVYAVDDGSTPPLAVPAACGPHRVEALRLDPNRGIEHALNAGLERILAAGHPLIARLDCGDLPMPGRLARQAEAMEARPELGMIGTWARCVDERGRYLYTLRFPHEHDAMVRRQRYVPAMLHPTVMIRAAALREVGPYSDRFPTAEDYDLFVRMAARHRVANIPEALTEYIVSAHGLTLNKRRRNLASRLAVQRAHFATLDPHAYLGVARTLAFMVLPASWLGAVKRRLWR